MTDWKAIDKACSVVPGEPPHPGEILQDWLAESEWPGKRLAGELGVSQAFVSMLTSGKKNVGPLVALKLEAATGVRAEVWLHLQAAHTLDRLRPKATPSP